MPPELSIHLRDEAAQQEAERDAMIVASGSMIERRIIEWLCQPIAARIPASIRPNTISLVTHVLAWMTALLAVGSVHLARPYKSLALLGAGAGMLLSMIGDCLDGMHARNTNQCSKLGEMMDHWLDAVIVPLVVLGASLALEMPPWAIAAVNVTAVMVYHGQLVLYHHTGKFIHPDATTGVEAQFGLSMGYAALGAFFYFVDRHQPWVDLAVAAIAVVGLYIQARCNLFYYLRLGRLLRYHLVFVGMCCGFAALYLVGGLGLYPFALLLTFTSFRICGTYVLHTIVRVPYDGQDWGIVAWLAAMFAGRYLLPEIDLGPLSLQALLPYLACVYMVARNMHDFSRHYAALTKPAAR